MQQLDQDTLQWISDAWADMWTSNSQSQRVKAAEAPQEDDPAELGHLKVKIEKKKRKMYKKKKQEVTVATRGLTLIRTCVYVCVTYL